VFIISSSVFSSRTRTLSVLNKLRTEAPAENVLLILYPGTPPFGDAKTILQPFNIGTADLNLSSASVNELDWQMSVINNRVYKLSILTMQFSLRKHLCKGFLALGAIPQ
jgi:hypothetical protein